LPLTFNLKNGGMQIYIHRNGEQFGPYSPEQTRDYLASGNLVADDLAWHEGAAAWAPLSQIAELFPAAAPATPPAPQAPRAAIPPRRTPGSAPAVVAARQRPAMAQKNIQRTGRRRSSSAGDYRRRQRAIGARNMGVGALLFVVGSAITFFSYEAASSSSHGGPFILAWGAIIFGGIRFVMGVVQYGKKW
jgi:hypothetical protein